LDNPHNLSKKKYDILLCILSLEFTTATKNMLNFLGEIYE